MNKPHVLFVLSSADKYIDGKTPTGWYLPEAAHPYYELKDKCKITWASPKGGKAPLDPASLEAFKEEAVCKQFLSDPVAQHAVENTLILSQLGASLYDAIFYVGGAGPCMDLYNDAHSIALIEELFASGKPVAAVCHAPVVFVKAKDLNTGKPLWEGREGTAICNKEEEANGFGHLVPVLPENAMREAGCIFKTASELWGSYACVARDSFGGVLISGQNPNSATAVGQALCKELKV